LWEKHVKIEQWAVDRVKPYERNPRKNAGAVEAVAASIRDFGFRQPIVVDGEGVIIVGHTRHLAAGKLGMKTVPVHVARDLPPEKVQALRLADNKLHELSTWDMDLLSIELAEVCAAGVDLELLGFSEKDLRDAGMGPEIVEDEAPEPLKTAETVRGDLWVLGEHRLLCGDSTDPADVAQVLDGSKAAMVATDPPYLVDYTGDRPNDSGKDWTADYREIDIVDADKFFRSLFTNVLQVIAPRAAIYCWHAHKRQGLIAKVWEDLGILDHQQIIWVKPSPVFGRVFWHFRHEPCMMGWVKGSMPAHDGDQTQSSVWEIDWEGKSRIVGNEHPTQKPVEIFARPMRKHTKPGDVCFEPFSGSGTQLVAAEQLSRRCCAIELSPVFVEVAVRRWQNLTGKKAERFGADGKKKRGIDAA
jgi:DNA modification methylase